MVEINLPKEKNNDAGDKRRWNGSYQIVKDQPNESPDALYNAVDGSNNAIEKIMETMDETRDIECGISFFRGSLLQKFANKKAFVIAYGICSLMLTASAGYYIAIGTTLEKIFKISSVTAAIISNGNNIGLLITCNLLSYCANNGHKPRWMAAGLFIMTISCCLFVSTHLIYGPGQDVERLTNYSLEDSSKNTTTIDRITESLCQNKELNIPMAYDHSKDSNVGAQVILFTARFLHGISDAILFSLGLAYMDDNIKKTKIPILIGISYLIKMAGPSIGFTFSGITLSKFIILDATPSIQPNDPRWIGAWWLGWVVFSVIIFIMACIMMCFPKTLPRAEARRLLALRRIDDDNNNNVNNNNNDTNKEEKEVISFWSTIEAFRRLIKNQTLVCINIAAVLFVFGYCPFWFHVVKYIEVVFRLSVFKAASETGSVSLYYGGLGIILSGLVVAKFKPSARYLAGFNALSCGIACLGILSYTFISCPANEIQIMEMKSVTSISGKMLTCNDSCNCDFVKYNPICTEDNKTFVSPCHAGCQDYIKSNDSVVTYTKCSCIINKNQGLSSEIYTNHSQSSFDSEQLGTAKPGACEVDCFNQLQWFMNVFSFVTFLVSAGAVPSFLLSLRCVDRKDKAVAMGVNLAIIGLFALMLSPVFFANIFDKTCLFWGSTPTSTGNCWLYDSEKLRYRFNLISAAFVGVGTFFYIGVWYLVRDLKIFDDEQVRAERF